MTNEQKLKSAFDNLEKSVESFIKILKTQDYDPDYIEESFENIAYELAERCNVITEHSSGGWQIHNAILWDVFQKLVESFVENTDDL